MESESRDQSQLFARRGAKPASPTLESRGPIAASFSKSRSVAASDVSSKTNCGSSELGSVPMPAMMVPLPSPEDLSPEQPAIATANATAAKRKRMRTDGEELVVTQRRQVQSGSAKCSASRDCASSNGWSSSSGVVVGSTMATEENMALATSDNDGVAPSNSRNVAAGGGLGWGRFRYSV